MTDLESLESLFFAALERSPADRPAYLDEACREKPELRQHLDRLLKAHEHAGPFLDAPASTGTFPPRKEEPTPTADYAGRDETVGAMLGNKYKLIEQIGEGGMGSVFMAQQSEPVKRAVAVKVIKAGMDSKAVLARFEAERQALAMMDHPNIARVLDAGTTDSGRPYFVMELVKGVPITQFCDERKLTPRQRLELFVPVCQAIQHAHQKGIIHRDIKPSNVLVALYDDRAVPKVIDFGVAKATGPTLTDKTLMTGFGAVVGTPEYMSPEQANLNNLDIDTRSDVYSLGVLLYELLTGSTPVDRKSLGKAAILEVLRIVREVEAPRPSAKLSTIDTLPSVAANRGTEPAKLSKLMRGELDWVVLKALEKDRSRRYESANGLAVDIQRYLADEIVEARPPSARYRMKKFVRRHRGQVIAASLVMIALLAGIAGTTWGLIEAKKQEKDAGAARDREADQRRKAEDERDEKEKARQQAVAEKERADREKAIAEAVKNFVTNDVFGRAGDRRLGQSADIKARTLLEAAAKTVGDKFKDQPEIELEVRYALGKGFLQIGLAQLASEQGPRLLELCRKHKTKDDPTTLEVLTDLALATLHSDQSLEWSREAFEARRHKHGDDHLLTAEAATQRIWLLHQRDPKEAMRLCDDYLPIARRKSGDTSELALGLSAYKALLLSRSGKIEEALTIYRQVHDAYEKMQMDWGLRPQHGTWYFIANLLLEQRKTREAIPLYLDDIARLSQAFGADHAEVTLRRTGLAKAYWIDRAYLKAPPVYFDVAEGDRRTHGPRSKTALAAQSQAVICLFIMDRLEIATARAEAWAGSDKADDLVNAASLLCMIAMEGKDRDVVKERDMIVIEQSKVRAMQFLQRAVDRGWRDTERLDEFAELRDRREFQVLVTRLTKGQPNTYPAVIAGQAGSLKQDGKYAQAIEKYLEAIRLQEIEVGRFPEDERARESLGNMHDDLGYAYLESGDSDRALKSHANAYDVRMSLYRQATGAHKPEYASHSAWSLHNQGIVHLSQRRFEKAAEFLSAAAELRESLLPGQPAVSPYRVAASRDLEWLGRTFDRAGRLNESEAAYRRALNLSETVMAGNFDVTGHRADVDRSRQQLAAVLIKLKRFAEARDIYRTNLDLYRKTYDAGVHDALVKLGSTLLLTEEWAEAEIVLKECLERRQKQFPDDWRTFNAMALLGRAKLGLQPTAEGERLLVAGCEGMMKRYDAIPLESRFWLLESLDRLIEISNATNRPDEEVKWRAERAKYREVAPPARTIVYK